ncbi:hypothetical protein SAMN03159475_0110 [Pseudomonas sp. NFPP33]|nr:hypothetical protein [Pseudomonas sp. NFPP33]SDA85326.1 hypothetical protein SAMN03159475_0110 [Pseudomonas sp. NFPP33]
MAKTDIELKFNLGKHVLCVEDGHGYAVGHSRSGSDAPGMFDGVNVTIRERTDKGQPGAIVDRQFDVKRSQILALALGLQDIASSMAVETTWHRSETVYSNGKQRPLFPLTKTEHAALCDLNNDELKGMRNNTAGAYDKLRRRVHILQRCQYVLERISDDSANQLDMLLTVLEHAGALPVRIETGISTNFEVMPGSETAH